MHNLISYRNKYGSGKWTKKEKNWISPFQLKFLLNVQTTGKFLPATQCFHSWSEAPLSDEHILLCLKQFAPSGGRYFAVYQSETEINLSWGPKEQYLNMNLDGAICLYVCRASVELSNRNENSLLFSGMTGVSESTRDPGSEEQKAREQFGHELPDQANAWASTVRV